MVKIKVLLLLLVAAAAAIASRDVRAPGGSGWQASSGFGGGLPSFGLARSAGGSWTGSGSGLGRSTGDGGWRGTNSLGFHGRRSGNGFGIRKGNGSPSNNGWSQSGYGSSGAYGGNSISSSPGWDRGFPGYDAVGSLDSSNGWEEPELGFRSNNDWQSSVW